MKVWLALVSYHLKGLLGLPYWADVGPVLTVADVFKCLTDLADPALPAFVEKELQGLVPHTPPSSPRPSCHDDMVVDQDLGGDLLDNTTDCKNIKVVGIGGQAAVVVRCAIDMPLEQVLGAESQLHKLPRGSIHNC